MASQLLFHGKYMLFLLHTGDINCYPTCLRYIVLASHSVLVMLYGPNLWISNQANAWPSNPELFSPEF